MKTIHKKSPEEIQSRLDEIKVSQLVGPIAPAMPMPEINGHPRHLAMLDGVTIWATFAQQPPKGSVPVGREDTKWRGNLLFLDPKNQIWTVPNVWYNNTWAHRIRSYKHTIAQVKERQDAAHTGIARLNKPQLSQDEKTQKREFLRIIEGNPEHIKRIQASIDEIRKCVDLNECPCLQPLPVN